MVNVKLLSIIGGSVLGLIAIFVLVYVLAFSAVKVSFDFYLNENPVNESLKVNLFYDDKDHIFYTDNNVLNVTLKKNSTIKLIVESIGYQYDQEYNITDDYYKVFINKELLTDSSQFEANQPIPINFYVYEYPKTTTFYNSQVSLNLLCLDSGKKEILNINGKKSYSKLAECGNLKITGSVPNYKTINQTCSSTVCKIYLYPETETSVQIKQDEYRNNILVYTQKRRSYALDDVNVSLYRDDVYVMSGKTDDKGYVKFTNLVVGNYKVVGEYKKNSKKYNDTKNVKLENTGEDLYVNLEFRFSSGSGGSSKSSSNTPDDSDDPIDSVKTYELTINTDNNYKTQFEYKLYNNNNKELIAEDFEKTPYVFEELEEGTYYLTVIPDLNQSNPDNVFAPIYSQKITIDSDKIITLQKMDFNDYVFLSLPVYLEGQNNSKVSPQYGVGLSILRDGVTIYDKVNNINEIHGLIIPKEGDYNIIASKDFPKYTFEGNYEFNKCTNLENDSFQDSYPIYLEKNFLDLNIDVSYNNEEVTDYKLFISNDQEDWSETTNTKGITSLEVNYYEPIYFKVEATIYGKDIVYYSVKETFRNGDSENFTIYLDYEEDNFYVYKNNFYLDDKLNKPKEDNNLALNQTYYLPVNIYNENVSSNEKELGELRPNLFKYYAEFSNVILYNEYYNYEGVDNISFTYSNENKDKIVINQNMFKLVTKEKGQGYIELKEEENSELNSELNTYYKLIKFNIYDPFDNFENLQIGDTLNTITNLDTYMFKEELDNGVDFYTALDNLNVSTAVDVTNIIKIDLADYDTKNTNLTKKLLINNNGYENYKIASIDWESVDNQETELKNIVDKLKLNSEINNYLNNNYYNLKYSLDQEAVDYFYNNVPLSVKAEMTLNLEPCSSEECLNGSDSTQENQIQEPKIQRDILNTYKSMVKTGKESTYEVQGLISKVEGVYDLDSDTYTLDEEFLQENIIDNLKNGDYSSATDLSNILSTQKEVETATIQKYSNPNLELDDTIYFDAINKTPTDSSLLGQGVISLANISSGSNSESITIKVPVRFYIYDSDNETMCWNLNLKSTSSNVEFPMNWVVYPDYTFDNLILNGFIGDNLSLIFDYSNCSNVSSKLLKDVTVISFPSQNFNLLDVFKKNGNGNYSLKINYKSKIYTYVFDYQGNDLVNESNATDEIDGIEYSLPDDAKTVDNYSKILVNYKNRGFKSNTNFTNVDCSNNLCGGMDYGAIISHNTSIYLFDDGFDNIKNSNLISDSKDWDLEYNGVGKYTYKNGQYSKANINDQIFYHIPYIQKTDLTIPKKMFSIEIGSCTNNGANILKYTENTAVEECTSNTNYYKNITKNPLLVDKINTVLIGVLKQNNNVTLSMSYGIAVKKCDYSNYLDCYDKDANYYALQNNQLYSIDDVFTINDKSIILNEEYSNNTDIELIAIKTLDATSAVLSGWESYRIDSLQDVINYYNEGLVYLIHSDNSNLFNYYWDLKTLFKNRGYLIANSGLLNLIPEEVEDLKIYNFSNNGKILLNYTKSKKDCKTEYCSSTDLYTPNSLSNGNYLLMVDNYINYNVEVPGTYTYISDRKESTFAQKQKETNNQIFYLIPYRNNSIEKTKTENTGSCYTGDSIKLSDSLDWVNCTTNNNLKNYYLNRNLNKDYVLKTNISSTGKIINISYGITVGVCNNTNYNSCFDSTNADYYAVYNNKIYPGQTFFTRDETEKKMTLNSDYARFAENITLVAISSLDETGSSPNSSGVWHNLKISTLQNIINRYNLGYILKSTSDNNYYYFWNKSGIIKKYANQFASSTG